MDPLTQLTHWIQEAKFAVFLGGAGISSASGLSTFRDEALSYQTLMRYGATPELILSYPYLFQESDNFYDFLRRYLYQPSTQPNKGHRALAKLEQAGVLKGLITQNIDGFHQVAGNQNVLELHGSLSRFYCSSCGREYLPQEILNRIDTPYCPSCTDNIRGQGLIRPDIVLYGEDLDQVVYWEARTLIKEADLLIVAGTSLTVYPAAELIHHFKGRHLIIINKESTLFDSQATLLIRDNAEDILTAVSTRISLTQTE